MATTTIAELELQITSNSDKAVQGLTNLTTALTSLKTAIKGGFGLSNVASQINALGEAIKKFPKLEKLEQLRDILAQIKGIGNIDISKGFEKTTTQQKYSSTELDTVGQEIQRVQNKIKEKQQFRSLLGLNANGDLVQKYDKQIEALENKLQRLKDIQQEVFGNTVSPHLKNYDEDYKQLKQQYERQYSSLPQQPIDNSQDKGLEQTATAVDNLDNSVKTEAKDAKKAKDENKKLGKEVENSGKSASKASSGFSKLIKSFGRIAFYRLVRNIIKEITAAFKEGINNLYQFSKEINGGFAESMDKIATASLSIRNSLGVALAPLIEVIAPVIEQIGDKFLELGNIISKVGAIMNDKNTYTKAVKTMKEYAQATKSAAQSFDELNIAQKDQQDYSSMFEEVTLEEDANSIEYTIGNILKDIKDIIKEIVTFLTPEIRKIIQDLLPIITDALQFVIGFIKEALPQIEPIIENIIDLVSRLLKRLEPIFEKIANSGTKDILNDIISLVNVIVDVLIPIIDDVLTLLEPIGNIVSALTQRTNNIVGLIIQDLKPVLQVIGEILEPIVDIVVSVLAPVLDTISLCIGGIADLLRPIYETVKLLGEGVLVLFTFDGDAIKEKWGSIITSLASIWGKWVENMREKWLDFIYGIGEKFVDFINNIIDALNWIGTPLMDLLKEFGVEVKEIQHINPQWLQDWKKSKEVPVPENHWENVVANPQANSLSPYFRVDTSQREEELAIMRETINSIRNAGGTGQDIKVYLDGKQIAASVEKSQRASGVPIAKGAMVI